MAFLTLFYDFYYINIQSIGEENLADTLLLGISVILLIIQ